MDIFERQEMRKNRPVVMSKLNDWYDWLISHVPKTIKDGASRAFKTFKDKIMGFYKGVTGNRDQHEIGGSSKPEPFNPIELLVEPTGVIGLTEDPRWMQKLSLIE